MLLEIHAEDEEQAAELRDFYRWLRDDEDGPERVTLAHRTGEATGAMGALEIIEVVLTQSAAAANLAMQYASWRRARGAGGGGTATGPGFTFRRADGLSVTVEGGSDDDVRRLLALLAAAPDSPSTSG
ncbi:MAG TPA: hypothetical protein VGL02_03485 [Streptomyces sp.]